MEKVIILGSGCAGYTAAIYTSRANLSPLMITGTELHGQLGLTTEVENYPGFPQGILGPELMNAMKTQAERFGTRIDYDYVQQVDFQRQPFILKTSEKTYEAKTVIVCTGSSPKKLGIPGEKEFLGYGVSTCATCDGAFYKGQELVVVGGGDTAMEEALFLTRYAIRVYVVHRRDTLRASKIMQERALKHPKIEFVWNSAVTQVVSEDNKLVTGVRVKNIINGEEISKPVSALFIAIGHNPNTEIFKGQLTLDQNGYIITDERQRTNITGVFAAGDVQDHVYRQAVTAAGTGCAAAIEAERYLSELED
jgi:thioredoxin reductase (NADPH)